jgi:RNA-directed DNA polymerase
VAEVLNAIYEADFYGFSYGFRPGRSPHGALASLKKALMTQRVNWVLDFDVQTFFDSLDHEWLVRMLEHRIADRRIIRLIERWLKAGILEGGEWRVVETGSPQGSGISPLLANVFLHYSFDAWISRWRRRQAQGQIVVIRYADDAIVGAEHESDARKLLDALRERLAKFGLKLNENKTRLIEFGRFAARRREMAGLRRPETFNFLGFTHYCGATRSGKFIVKRRTQATRMVRKLKELRVEMRKRWHWKVPEQHAWLSQVLRGHYRYYGLIFNHRSMNQFYHLVKRMWFKALQRRSQKSKINWTKFDRLQTVFPLPRATIHQSWHGGSG